MKKLCMLSVLMVSTAMDAVRLTFKATAPEQLERITVVQIQAGPGKSPEFTRLTFKSEVMEASIEVPDSYKWIALTNKLATTGPFELPQQNTTYKIISVGKAFEPSTITIEQE